MDIWLKISLMLCTYGFFRELRPSDPFINEFLSGKWRNITQEQVNRDVFPWIAYSQLSQLVIIFLVTDILRYKPVIVISSCVGIILWSLLLWTYTLAELQMSQIFYGTFMAAEIAYYTYMYAKVDRSKYQQVTGHTRAAILCGRFVAGVLAQLIISYDLMDYRELNFISLGSQCISLVWALLLPSVDSSMYFYSKKFDDDVNQSKTDTNSAIESNGKKSSVYTITTSITTTTTTNTNGVVGTTIDNQYNNGTENNIYTKKVSFSCRTAFRLLWIHFKTAYTNEIVIQWSLWWALGTCGFLMVQIYVQILWAQIDLEQNEANVKQVGQLYNGAVEAALTLLGAIGAFGTGFLNSKKFNGWDLWIISGCSIVQGVFILWSAFTNNIWIAYVMYILFGVIYHFMITVASATVAKIINEDSFALIFGINTLLAVLFQTILTLVVVSEDGLALDTHGQFTVFGGYFVVLSIIYGVTGLVKLTMNNNS